MKNFVFLWLCFIGIHYGNSQEFLLEGTVYDTQSGKPIPFVNISLMNTLKGTSSDESGRYFVELPVADKEKMVHISALGYRDSITTVQALFHQKKIGLKETSYELDEVVVTENLGNVEILNPLSSAQLSSGFASSATPWIIAVYFPNSDGQFKVLDKVTVYLQKVSDSRNSASKFRLRIFEADPATGLPGKDLLKESHVLDVPYDAEYCMADLAPARLQVPKDGMFIGLEWLFIPYNWYRESGSDPISKSPLVEDRFLPTFAGVYKEDPSLKAAVYGSGQWRDFRVRSRDNSSTLIPAISVRLIKE